LYDIIPLQKSAMRLGINSYTFMWSIGFDGAVPAKPLTARGLLDRARDLGVRVVQFGPNLPLDRQEISEVKALYEYARSLDLEIEICTRGLEAAHIEAQIELCGRMGAKLLRTIPELAGETPPVNEIAHQIQGFRSLLERSGVCLALENGKVPAKELASCVEQAGSDHIGVVLDTVNSLAIPEGWRYVAETLAPYVMCLHLKEFVIKRVWHMMGFVCEGRPAGSGQLDIPWLLKACQRSRYPYSVVVELWPPQQKSLEDTITLEHKWAYESISAVKRFIAQAG
jgi:sugar phosphate isomerase/epimerase